MAYREGFGDAVKKALGERSYRQVAPKVGISPSHLGNMVQGFAPRQEVVVRFAEAVGADVNELLRAAGYAPLELPKEPTLTPQERLGIGLARLGEEYPDAEELTVRRFGGWKNLTHAQVDRILQAAEEELKRRQVG